MFQLATYKNNYIQMKKFILIGFILNFALLLQAQDDGFYSSEENKDNKETKKEIRQQKLARWSFGGNFWLSFGTDAYVELSPIALYQVTPKLKVGPGFTFIYYKYSYYNIESKVYGPRAIATYTLISDLQEKINLNIGNIVLHSEYEYLNTDEISIYGPTDNRIWISNLLVGGGIFQPFGNRGGLSLIVLYNVFDHQYSAYNYTNPVIRVGFYF